MMNALERIASRLDEAEGGIRELEVKVAENNPSE